MSTKLYSFQQTIIAYYVLTDLNIDLVVTA
jgi:hypothetical protein